MAACPTCGTQLKDEYGMSQCPGCGAFAFVDMEGNAFISEESPTLEPSQEPANVEAARESTSGGFRPYEPEIIIEANPGFDAVDSAFNIDPIERPSETPSDFSSDLPSYDSQATPLQEASYNPDISIPSDDFSTDTHGQAVGPAGNPLGLEEFANSEASSAKDGPLLFRILISGIDSKELRESIREVLEDSRFAWDAAAILARIAKGELAIDGVAPVKASILVNRIKRLPIKIRWEQYAISQAGST